MLETLQYVTNGLWIFVGSTIFVCGGTFQLVGQLMQF
jgi:hypothetical protein